jgi:hypothetical protein
MPLPWTTRPGAATASGSKRFAQRDPKQDEVETAGAASVYTSAEPVEDELLA